MKNFGKDISQHEKVGVVFGLQLSARVYILADDPTFVLPKEYRLYEQAGSDLPSLPPDDDMLQSSDKDNRRNGKHEGEIKDGFYSAASSDSDDSTGNGGAE